MMDAVFSAGNTLTLLGWVTLILAPFIARLRRPAVIGAGLVLPAALGIAYVILIATHWGQAEGGFGSIPEVRALFDTPGILVAGWFHYLAFDLFVGGWIVRQGERAGVRHWTLIPSLALTFLFGPAGFLLFLATRAALRRAPAPEETAS